MFPGQLAINPSGRTVATAFVETRRGEPKTAQLVIDYFDIGRGRQVGSASVAGIARVTSFDWLRNDELLVMGTNTSAQFVMEVVRVNGSIVKRIVLRLPSAATVTDAALSPAGSSLAVTEVIHRGQCGEETQTVYQPCPSDIYTVALSGGNPRRRTFTNSASSLVWSPDGRQLAFENASGRSDEVLTLATGRTRALVMRIPLGGVNLVDRQPQGA